MISEKEHLDKQIEKGETIQMHSVPSQPPPFLISAHPSTFSKVCCRRCKRSHPPYACPDFNQQKKHRPPTTAQGQAHQSCLSLSVPGGELPFWTPDRHIMNNYGTASKHQKPNWTHRQAFPYTWHIENRSTLLDGLMWRYTCMEKHGQYSWLCRLLKHCNLCSAGVGLCVLQW